MSGRFDTRAQAITAALKFRRRGEMYQIFEYKNGTFDFLVG